MKKQLLIGLMVFSSLVQAEVQEISNDLQKYTNQITGIHEIQGQKNYTLHLSFEQDHPIAVYAPQSFQESQDNKMHRFILPNTQLACVNSCDCVQQQHDDIELTLQGTLLLNVIGQDFILMTVAQD